MIFSDCDLKRLKNMFVSGTKGRVSWEQDKWLALIARLEAAERICVIASDHVSEPFMKAWRKAAGK